MKVKESSNFDQIVLQAALQHYPPRARPDTPPTQPVELANSARHMWQLFRQMRSYRFNMLGVVKAWKLWVQFSRAHAIHKQRANARAKAKRDELLQQAQQAAEHKNMHELWTVVKRLAPKCRFKKVQLHKHGVIIAPEAELDWIAQAFGERFGVHLAKEPPPLQRQHAPVQLAEQEVAAALHHIPVRKAVPRGTLPAAFWRACADQIAAPLTVAVNQAWQAPQVNVHQPWANADVALLPKGKKQVKTPLDLRPIGLQHPIGKTLMKVLTSKAKEHITCLVKQWPQTAFVPGRSTATALKVVFSHCYGIRQACAQARLNLHQKHEGQASQHKAPPLRGGLQVSLDLTAAFDLVNWSHLCTALSLAGVDPSIQEILLQWLRQVVYVFHHKGGTQEVRPSWGLRQGCPASPFLWAVFTALLSQAFDQQFYSGWSAEHAVMYADDSHLRWSFDSYAGFERAIIELRCVMRIFAQFDMQINFQKTQALLLTTGTAKSKLIKHYVRNHTEGRRLLLSPSDPRHWILLVPQAEYLRLIISYDRFEALSVRHRISKAHQRRWALASILHSRKLAKQHKLHIWRSCVQTTLLYGLHCLGLSQKLLNEIQVACMKHLRAIVSDQQHLTGHTHQEIMAKYKVDSALSHLKQAHDRELRIQANNDWMQQWKWNQDVTANLETLHEAHSNEESDPEQATEGKVESQSFQLPSRETPDVPPLIKQIQNTMNFAEPDQEMAEFFGTVKPPLFPKAAGQEGMNPKRRREADPHRSKWQGWDQEDWEHPSRYHGRRPSSSRDPLLLSVARLALRHEEELKLLQQDTSLVLWFSPGSDSILGHLYQTAVAFKKRQQDEPTWGLAHVPLKQVMATAMFRELRERHHKVWNTPELLKKAEEMGWKDNQGWVFQTWNPQLRHLERDRNRPPIPDTEMSNKLEFFITHMNKNAEEIWDMMMELQGCCVFQLIGLGYRHAFVNSGANVSDMGQGASFFRHIMMSDNQVDLMQVQLNQSIDIPIFTDARMGSSGIAMTIDRRSLK
ncbi:LINE-1 retrotransposable element ORF2 protein [Symbiodinium microadriaticum]|uniref:LINE-1 retrotransposable element ORF2 protein n=1 Tax=Symbiodinium microadriaticum TaxID=2951 RepID=A0A1Q9DEN2_SYMMI|nr:LINE-1 retrotransposable element ORF2 protein [Symbiodinium microadriaticum]